MVLVLGKIFFNYIFDYSPPLIFSFYNFCLIGNVHAELLLYVPLFPHNNYLFAFCFTIVEGFITLSSK